MIKKRFFHVRSILVGALILALSIGGTINASAEQVQKVPTAGIAINGKTVNGINPIKIDGTYYLPFVQLSKILGYNHVKFEDRTLTYEVTDGSTKIRTTMGGTKARKGNEYINIKPPRWINETAYISLHAGGALFNVYITFKDDNGSIQIQKPARQYTVHTGDSLWMIAHAHHTTVSELKAANNLKTNRIKDGQVLKLPTDGKAKEMEPIKEQEPIKQKNTNTLNELRQSIINEAKKYIGAGYKFGATLSEAPNLFDCSSYTQLVFQNNGIQLPRVSRDQASKGRSVATKDLITGDLLFFTTNDLYSDGRVGHVGIYMGNGDMIHASTSKGVTITKDVLANPYWSANYLFSKRIVE